MTIAGSSCGVMPIAIASENSSASSSGRERATLITKIEIVSTPATRTSSLEKSRRPDLERGLGLPLAEPDGDLAERGARARRDHDPSPGALVHDGAHERARREVDGRVAPRRLRPSSPPGIDSPVSTASSHSSWRRLDQPQVRRDDVADAERDDVAGHEVARRRRVAGAVAPARAPRGGCCACSAATALAERYSLTKPSPTLRTTIAAMIPRRSGRRSAPTPPPRRAAGSAAGCGAAGPARRTRSPAARAGRSGRRTAGARRPPRRSDPSPRSPSRARTAVADSAPASDDVEGPGVPGSRFRNRPRHPFSRRAWDDPTSRAARIDLRLPR